MILRTAAICCFWEVGIGRQRLRERNRLASGSIATLILMPILIQMFFYVHRIILRKECLNDTGNIDEKEPGHFLQLRASASTPEAS